MIQKINSGTSLREAIILLEKKRADQEKALREQLHLTYESMRPVNIIKNTYREVTASEDLKDNLVNTSVGLVVGYLSKALFESVSHSPVRKLLGTAVLFGVTTAVRKNPEAVKSMANAVFRVIHSAIKAAGKRPSPEPLQQIILMEET